MNEIRRVRLLEGVLGPRPFQDGPIESRGRVAEPVAGGGLGCVTGSPVMTAGRHGPGIPPAPDSGIYNRRDRRLLLGGMGCFPADPENPMRAASIDVADRAAMGAVRGLAAQDGPD